MIDGSGRSVPPLHLEARVTRAELAAIDEAGTFTRCATLAEAAARDLVALGRVWQSLTCRISSTKEIV